MKPGPTARAALVLLAFLAVFTIVDRMSAPDGGRHTAAAPPGAVGTRATIAGTDPPAAGPSRRAPSQDSR